jgi:hypothetical protein
VLTNGHDGQLPVCSCTTGRPARRPFFTIHDPVFREYAKAGQTPPPAILGVTNPYFNNAFSHWPHVVRLLDPNQNSLVRARKQGIGHWPAFFWLMCGCGPCLSVAIAIHFLQWPSDWLCCSLWCEIAAV